MIVSIAGVETVYDAPPGVIGVYRIYATFHNGGSAVFVQQCAAPPKVGQDWEMAEIRLDKLANHADGRPR